MVVPLEATIPVTAPEVLELLNEYILLLKILLAVAPETERPVTVAAVDDKEPIVLLFIFMVEDAFEQVIPETVPPVPVEDRPVIVFDAIVNVVEELKEAP